MIDEIGVEEAAESDKATYGENDSENVLRGDGHGKLVIHKSLLTPKEFQRMIGNETTYFTPLAPFRKR